MRQLELVKIARSKTMSHVSDNSIFLHRTNASLVYVWWPIQQISSDNNFFLCYNFYAAKQKLINIILFSGAFSIRVCTMKNFYIRAVQ